MEGPIVSSRHRIGVQAQIQEGAGGLKRLFRTRQLVGKILLAVIVRHGGSEENTVAVDFGHEATLARTELVESGITQHER